jgi:uncharacterized membrane protein YvbJ
MSLIPCPECGREISIAAEACPGCGHPNRVRPHAPTGPTCYSCSAAATTRCQSCGALSCAEHLQSIYVTHGRGGAYELRCQSCYESAKARQIVGWIIFAIILVFVAIIFFGFRVW